MVPHDRLGRRVWSLGKPRNMRGAAHPPEASAPQARRRRLKPHLHLRRTPRRLSDAEGETSGEAEERIYLVVQHNSFEG